MIIDLHNDTPLKLYLYRYDFQDGGANLDIDAKKVIDSKEKGLPVKALFFAFCLYPVCERSEALPLLEDMLNYFNNEMKKTSSVFEQACSLKDLERINASGKTAVFYCLEGAYVVNEPEHIDELHKLGFRLLTLTHNASSSWAGSCTKPEEGLKNNGKEIIKRMNELGVIVDLAHTSKKTVLDVVNITSKPVVYSHGGAMAMSESVRAIDDDVIKAIASTGGLIGITVYPEQLTKLKPGHKEEHIKFTEKRNKLFGNKTLSPFEKLKRYCDLCYFDLPIPDEIPSYEVMFDNIDHIVKLVGDDHVCIGSDYDGARYRCRGMEDISKLYLLRELMQKRSYSASRVEKILSGNVMKLIENVY